MGIGPRCNDRGSVMLLDRIARRVVLLGLAAIAFGATRNVVAADEIRVTRQYGLPYLPLMVMEHEQLLEKHLKAAGIAEAKVTWATMATTTATVDGLLSGSVDFA